MAFVPTASRARSIDRDGLRRELARLGVPLFERSPAGPVPSPGVGELAALVVALVGSGDPRLVGSLPCLLTEIGGERARSTMEAALAANPELGDRLGWCYRLARALAISREFDLRRSLGHAPTLPASVWETVDLPDPSEQFGELTLWRASERSRARGEPDAAGELASLFDTWIRLKGVARAHERA